METSFNPDKPYTWYPHFFKPQKLISDLIYDEGLKRYVEEGYKDKM